VTVTKDSSDIIGGSSSLKIMASEGGEWSMLFRTEPDVIDLPSFHSYKISFDYKVLSDSASDGYYFVVIRPVENVADGAVNYGWLTIPGLKKGDTGTFEGAISVDKDSQNNAVAVGGFKVGSIVIDNFTIEEQ
jgi:hypothetical protein